MCVREKLPEILALIIRDSNDAKVIFRDERMIEEIMFVRVVEEKMKNMRCREARAENLLADTFYNYRN